MKTTQDNTELEVHVYSSDKNQYGFWATLKNIFTEFPLAHSLGLRFAQRSINTRYRQSFFGFLWAFVPPLATATIWIILNKIRVINLPDVGAPYPLFVITGTMLWSVFTNAILTPMQVIQTNRNILVKINFPRESLLVNAFYEMIFNTLISFVIIIVALVYYQVPVTASSFLFLPGIFLLMMLGFTIGLLLLPFSLLLKDIQFLLPSVLQFAMYLTPVVYAKQPFSGLGVILKINPVSPILIQTRAFLLHMDVYAPAWQIGTIAGASLFLLVIGVFLQRITMQTLIERMGT